MKLILIHNPKSGSALSQDELQQKCQDANIEIEEFIEVQDGFEKKLAPHIQAGKHIAALGGDGTVSAVAGQLADTNATLMPLPGGTLNHFTKDLGVPQDIDEALARLTQLTPRSIDIAEVNGTYFINNSSIGLYPTSLQDREEIEDTVGKWPAAVAASLRALVSFKTYRVTIDNHTFATPFIFVGNNRYQLDALGSTERTRLDEGTLTVYVAKTRSRLTLLKIAVFALLGRASELPEFDEFYTQSLTIKSNKRHLDVSHDGEISRIATPLAYEIHTKALRVVA